MRPLKLSQKPFCIGLTRLDIVPRDARILCPGKDCVRGELGAVVRNDHTRLAAGDVPPSC